MRSTTVETISFSKHLRNRASTLINLLPFEHVFKNVLSAIAFIDWHREGGATDKVRNCETYLRMAGVTCDRTCAAYLDWLEVRMRHHLNIYEQTLNCHKQELIGLIKEFENVNQR
jgi:hypothetical protein